MSTQKNLITLCFAAVSTLGLAACGGGDASVTETTVIEPVVDTTLEEIAAEAAAVVAATKAAATKLTAITWRLITGPPTPVSVALASR